MPPGIDSLRTCWYTSMPTTFGALQEPPALEQTRGARERPEIGRMDNKLAGCAYEGAAHLNQPRRQHGRRSGVRRGIALAEKRSISRLLPQVPTPCFNVGIQVNSMYR